MGIVYRAWDPDLCRKVALKFLHESPGSPPESRERFIREAQVAGRLNHPAIAAVYGTGEWMGQAYLSMQLIEGIPLGDARLGTRAAVTAMRDVARTLRFRWWQVVALARVTVMESDAVML